MRFHVVAIKKGSNKGFQSVIEAPDAQTVIRMAQAKGYEVKSIRPETGSGDSGKAATVGSAAGATLASSAQRGGGKPSVAGTAPLRPADRLVEHEAPRELPPGLLLGMGAGAAVVGLLSLVMVFAEGMRTMALLLALAGFALAGATAFLSLIHRDNRLALPLGASGACVVAVLTGAMLTHSARQEGAPPTEPSAPSGQVPSIESTVELPATEAARAVAPKPAVAASVEEEAEPVEPPPPQTSTATAAPGAGQESQVALDPAASLNQGAGSATPDPRNLASAAVEPKPETIAEPEPEGATTADEQSPPQQAQGADDAVPAVVGEQQTFRSTIQIFQEMPDDLRRSLRTGPASLTQPDAVNWLRQTLVGHVFENQFQIVNARNAPSGQAEKAYQVTFELAPMQSRVSGLDVALRVSSPRAKATELVVLCSEAEIRRLERLAKGAHVRVRGTIQKVTTGLGTIQLTLVETQLVD